MPLSAPLPTRSVLPGKFAPTALVVRARPDEDAAAFAARAIAQLAERKLRPLLAFWFGRTPALRALTPRTQPDCPALLVEGRPCHAGPMVGVQFYAAPADAEVRVHRRPAGALAVEFYDGRARHLLGVGPAPTDPAIEESTQAAAVLDRTARFVAECGFEFRDVARTWFFNRRILDWYERFNRVRSACYGEVAFRSGATPASTGIEGTPANGAALALAWWAVRPNDATSRPARPLASPLQCPAPEYGSAFSRAMEVSVGAGRRVFVSGTASIAPDGRSVHGGDIGAQIGLTLDVIEALLKPRRVTLADVDRAFAYFKHPADLAAFDAALAARGLDGLSFLPMHCDVCRDDLLFELEADAVEHGQVTFG